MRFVNNEDEDEDIIFLRIKALLPLLHRGGQQKRIDRFVVPLFEEAENARDAAALRTPTLVIAFRIVIVLKMERDFDWKRTEHLKTLQKKEYQMGGPYSGSSLARFVRVGAVATGITYGFVVSGVWSLVRLL